MKQDLRQCAACNRTTMHAKRTTGFGCLTNIVLTVCTLGFWLPFALLTMGAASLGNAVESWHCQECKNWQQQATEHEAGGVSLARVFVMLAAILGFFAWSMSQ